VRAFGSSATWPSCRPDVGAHSRWNGVVSWVRGPPAQAAGRGVTEDSRREHRDGLARSVPTIRRGDRWERTSSMAALARVSEPLMRLRRSAPTMTPVRTSSAERLPEGRSSGPDTGIALWLGRHAGWPSLATVCWRP